MNHQDRLEVETKLYMPDLEGVARKLQSAGARLVKPRVFERNIRYENAEKTLTAQGIVVRLRQDTAARLTYKAPLDTPVQDGILSRFEAEVEVSDFDTMQVILSRLGYHAHLVYEKWRTTYAFGETEIVLDELPYGNFVEIEGSADAILRAMNVLDLQDVPRFATSYQALFERVKQRLKLDFNDLTFENFKHIDVPEHVFRGLD